MRTIIGITGASGVIFGVRFLERCPGEKVLVLSEWGGKILKEEVKIRKSHLRKFVQEIYEDDELDAPVSSGSNLFDAFVIIPCSVSTLSKISVGISDTLITRVAQVALKERRKLILCLRETPLSSVVLESALKLSNQGTMIMPISPPFYTKPKTLEEVIDAFVNKVLVSLGVPVSWGWKKG